MMTRILIAGNIGDIESEEFCYSKILARELSANFKIYLSGSFFKMLKLAANVDAVFALSPIGGGYAGYLSAKFLKKKFLTTGF